MKQVVIFLLLAVACTGLQSCKIYSFTGANISPDIKSFTVENFPNNAGNGPVNLSQSFTDRLKQKMSQEANLRQTSSDGDVVFSGYFKSYSVTYENPIQGSQTALNKLTVGLEVTFVNSKDENDKWTQSFSRFAQYPASDDINQVENRLIEEINTQLVDDIFQKAFVKW